MFNTWDGEINYVKVPEKHNTYIFFVTLTRDGIEESVAFLFWKDGDCTRMNLSLSAVRCLGDIAQLYKQDMFALAC